MYKNFEEIINNIDKNTPKKLAVVWAGEAHIIEAVLATYQDRSVIPILIGNKATIINLLNEADYGRGLRIIHASSPEEAVSLAIRLVQEGEADILLKGMINTSTILGAIVKKENAMCKSSVLSHVSLQQIPGHNKLIALTDSALLTYPTKEQKVHIIQNAVNLLLSIGVKLPKVAILTAVETVNPKMPETVEAAELKEMQLKGVITSCIVEGPISYDLAMDPSSAKIKGYDSPVAGDADILVVPNIQAGNILVKCLNCTAHSKSVGLVVGAKVPIIITSRSAPIENKRNAINVAASIDF